MCVHQLLFAPPLSPYSVLGSKYFQDPELIDTFADRVFAVMDPSLSTYEELVERYGKLEEVSDGDDFPDSMARMIAETCTKCGVRNHLGDFWTGFTCVACGLTVCEDCECGCWRCVDRLIGSVCYYCCRREIPPTEDHLVRAKRKAGAPEPPAKAGRMTAQG